MIKKLLTILIVTMLAASCATQFRTMPEMSQDFFFDFGKYEAEGFRVSPYSWEGNNFTWIGEYSLEETPAIVTGEQTKTVTSVGGAYWQEKQVSAFSVPEQLPLDRDAMLEKFVMAAKQKGADAAVNFTFDVVIEDVDLSTDGTRMYIFPRATYIMKAYLIRR